MYYLGRQTGQGAGPAWKAARIRKGLRIVLSAFRHLNVIYNMQFVVNAWNYNYRMQAASAREALNRCIELALERRTCVTLCLYRDGKVLRIASVAPSGKTTLTSTWDEATGRKAQLDRMSKESICQEGGISSENSDNDSV